MPLNVLIIEDDPQNRELLAEIIEPLDVVIRCASDGREALDLIADQRFDGVFLDLEVPCVHGLEIARRIRKSHWNQATPIIVVTGSDDRKSMENAFAVGSTFFLQKPIERHKIVRLFRAVCGSMKEQQRRFFRASVEIDVFCQSGTSHIQGMTRNISLGGMLFDTRGGAIHTGLSVRLSFRLPSGRREIVLFGTVVRIDEQRRAGIRFSAMDNVARTEISQFIDQRGK